MGTYIIVNLVIVLGSLCRMEGFPLTPKQGKEPKLRIGGGQCISRALVTGMNREGQVWVSRSDCTLWYSPGVYCYVMQFYFELTYLGKDSTNVWLL